MADFDIAANLVLKQEGGYSNNPNDPGGETKYGIAKKFHPDVDLSTLTPVEAVGIYLSDYWIPSWSDLSQNVANLLLSLSVNMGKVSAIRIAQQAVGLNPSDGIWGDLTQHAVSSTPNVSVEIALKAIKIYLGMNQPTFISGWIRRVLEAM